MLGWRNMFASIQLCFRWHCHRVRSLVIDDSEPIPTSMSTLACCFTLGRRLLRRQKRQCSRYHGFVDVFCQLRLLFWSNLSKLNVRLRNVKQMLGSPQPQLFSPFYPSTGSPTSPYHHKTVYSAACKCRLEKYVCVCAHDDHASWRCLVVNILIAFVAPKSSLCIAVSQWRIPITIWSIATGVFPQIPHMRALKFSAHRAFRRRRKHCSPTIFRMDKGKVNYFKKMVKYAARLVPYVNSA